MPDANEVTDYLEVDDNNYNVAGISVQQNVMTPSMVDDAFRALMGALKRLLKTSIFRLRDSTDQTKLLAFSLSGLTTGTTRTVTFPDANITLPIITPWVTYVPTFVGMASPPQLLVQSRRNGPDLEVIALWQNGAVSASTFSMTLGYNGTNGGITVSNAWTGLNFSAGGAIWNSLDYSLNILATGGSSTVKIGVSGPGNDSFFPVLGSSLVGGTVISARFSVPIQGWN